MRDVETIDSELRLGAFEIEVTMDNCSIVASDGSADHRKLSLPVIRSRLNDPLCGPVVDA
jgi:hypothetical protein